MKPESPIRVLFAGGSEAGSWEMRGKQIASTRSNWKAEHDPKETDGWDVFCFVKHPRLELMRELKNQGKVVVYDVIDSWKQPEEGMRIQNADEARVLFQEKWIGLTTSAFIFPNQAMQADLGRLTPHSTVIYHHYRPEIVSPVEIRKQAKILAYEGNTDFLGEWRRVAERVAKKVGLKFECNPKDISTADIGFAARGGKHRGYMPHRYKSNVKLANFYGLGLPCVVQADEQSYRETDRGEVVFFRDEAELEKDLSRLLDAGTREKIQRNFLQHRHEFHLETIASQYERFFATLLK